MLKFFIARELLAGAGVNRVAYTVDVCSERGTGIAEVVYDIDFVQ